MPDRKKSRQAETKKHSFTTRLKHRFLGKDRKAIPVDTKFIADLSDLKSVGRYQIIAKLGRGSMGMVFLGRDPYIKRNVAIKVSRHAKDVVGQDIDRYREKFFVEAQSAGRLVHPNIVSIYDAGMYRDFCYMTMEYIDGYNLKRFCRKDYFLPLSKVIEVIFAACNALDYAHRQGVVHRDIKPSNIMIDKAGHLKITDFGIAQIKSEQTASKGIIGSINYMSPEHVRELPIEDKSDIFSLGCVLYELITGEKAFTGENDFSIMYKIVREDPVPLRKIRPEAPEIIIKIIQKALAKDPGDRYQTCGDFAYDLRVALRGFKGTIKKDKIKDVIDYVQNVPFFENFSNAQVKEILYASNLIRVRKGKIVVAEGDIDDSFYIILSGRAAVNKNGKNIALIERGECFGEMAYVSGQARAATVLAYTDCILMKISATLLDKSSESVQLLFSKNFAKTLVKRISKVAK